MQIARVTLKEGVVIESVFIDTMGRDKYRHSECIIHFNYTGTIEDLQQDYPLGLSLKELANPDRIRAMKRKKSISEEALRISNKLNDTVWLS